jgi:ABC-type uncharacterized transport system auxiliary subunit
MKKLGLLLMLASFLLLNGCFGSVPDTKYYLLDYVPTPPPERLEAGPYPYSLRIREFSVAEAFRRNQIVYRKSAHELLFYNYELWAVKPEYLVTDMAFRHLREANLFERIARTAEDRAPDFILHGEVTAIEEYDNNEKWYAHLAINFRLENARTREVLWAKPYDYRKEVKYQEPVYVIRALSFLLETIMNDVTKEVEEMVILLEEAGDLKRNSTLQKTSSPEADPAEAEVDSDREIIHNVPLDQGVPEFDLAPPDTLNLSKPALAK